MQEPVLFTLCLHAHQPVGNFDHVFEEHLLDVYEPFLTRALEDELLPLTLHLSGPLLDWLETHGSDYLDLVGQLASEGKLELLLAGYYEPILPSLLREDRIGQIQWMQEALRTRFGVEATGLWLTERVWEPDLAGDLVDAGVQYVLVDDRHFVAAGFSKSQLHQPFRTEFGGKSLGVFAIDEKLRYFLPFRLPSDTAVYLRELREAGNRLAVAADDIEKFGGWPGTREWVYEQGWLGDFTRAIKGMEAEGEVKLATLGQALAELPSGGSVYLPSSSYREMEEWALPAPAFHRLEELKKNLEQAGLDLSDSPLIRGSHWRNFLVKYSEANRMHKKATVLSKLCRERGDPQGARRALGAAQCNDAYWHGVFGGLYLRHLRDTVWKRLAEAEGLLRDREDLAWERTDLDLDGHEELWVHSSEFSALVSPGRGGAVEELTLFKAGVNLVNTLTRRREPYHEQDPAEGGPEKREGDVTSEGESREWETQGNDLDDLSTTPSIHDLEETLTFPELPPIDGEDRALFLDRILPVDLEPRAYQDGQYHPLLSWAGRPLEFLGVEEGGAVSTDAGQPSPSRWLDVCLGTSGTGGYKKRIRFDSDGNVEVLYGWDPKGFPGEAFFSTELSLGAEATVTAVPDSATWRFPISTFSKSERGFDETIQGESVTIRWPIATGWGRIRLTRE